MEVFTGVKVPTGVFPLWAKVISFIFPLTYAIEAIRRVFLNGEGLSKVQGFIGTSTFIIILMFLLINICTTLAEKHSKKTGNMTLF
jgi:ABC-2 type transport system permease protein